MAKFHWLFLCALTLFAACTPPATTAVLPTTQPPTAELPTAEPPTATAEPPTAVPPTATAISPTATPTPAATSTPLPSPRPQGNGRFTIYANDPVVPHGPPGSWDRQFTDPGAVVYHDGQFHMFHNGFIGWPAPVGIAHSTSSDGYTWSRTQDEAVFSGNELDYVGLTALASSALVTDDGTWVLYFYTWDAPTWPASGAIGRATAPSPTGPWTADPAPVLRPGSSESWDAYAVRAPSVVRTDDGYIMFYAGYTQKQGMIGMATSSDGITWTKYNDPATTAPLFTESDPIFTPGEPGTWDTGHVLQPRVEYTPDGFVMLYSASPQVNGRGSKIGYAISQDGLMWQRFATPVLETGPIPGGLGIWYTELLYQNDTYFLYFEMSVAGSTESTQVYLATHEGPLQP